MLVEPFSDCPPDMSLGQALKRTGKAEKFSDAALDDTDHGPQPAPAPECAAHKLGTPTRPRVALAALQSPSADDYSWV